MPGPLEAVMPALWKYADSVNVYVLQFESKRSVLFDLGSGAVLAAMEREGLGSPAMVFHTDYRRDRTYGHHIHPGLPVAAGAGDLPFFERAEDLWRDVNVYHGYGGYERFWMPRRSIPVSQPLLDGALPIWDKPYVYAQHTPGHTQGALSYMIIHEGKRYVVCGDALQWDGTLHSIYELQRTYNFMEGLHGVRRSAAWLAAGGFDGVFPAHGPPVLGQDRVRHAAETLIRRIDAFWERWRLIWPDQPSPGIDDFAPVTKHLLACTNHVTFALTDDDGHAVLFDTGIGFADGLEDLLASRGIRSVEYVLITHHHDDHVAEWDRLTSLYRPKLVTHRCMEDILRNPSAYALNCLHHEPLPVDVVLSDGDVFEWRGYRIECYHFPSQTEYHCVYLVEVDGRRVLFSGDALYWQPDRRSIRPTNPDWRNRFDVDRGYLVCAPLLRKLRPDLLAAAHVRPQGIAPEALERFGQDAQELHDALRALVGRKHPTLGIDPFWVSVYPYRTVLTKGSVTSAKVRIDNPLDREAEIVIEPRVPEGIEVTPDRGSYLLPPKAHVRLPFALRAHDVSHIDRRALWTLDVTYDGEPLGEAFEAMLEAEPTPD